MIKKFFYCVDIIIFVFLICVSCNDNIYHKIKYNYEAPSTEKKEVEKRMWSILVYMAADNDLEYAAIEDIYEMECSNLNTDKVSVFFLLDRSNAYDTSNDNWTGTRLYELKTGRETSEKGIISKEISCAELGLSEGVDTDLDMSSEYVLAESLSFIKEKYPAESFGLIMWGHGTGWRSGYSCPNENIFYKGFAYDNSSGSYMTLKKLGEAVTKGMKGQKLDFLGLDTCFSSEIEVMYELRNQVKYSVGTEGLILMSGWNYKNIFNDFEADKLKNPRTLAHNIINNFSSEYSSSLGAAIAGIDMSFVDEYFCAFDKIMKFAAENIKTRNDRDSISNMLLSKNKKKTISYSYGKENSDVYLDINSIVSNFYEYFANDKEIKKCINDFNDIKDKCVIEKWSSDKGNGCIGVYYGTLTKGNLISSVHPDSYIKGNSANQIQFVSDSLGYVPNSDSKNSLLDKLFYTSFNN